MISVITTGRDDNYGDHFIESMQISISRTISILEREKLDYEIVIVDWSPIDALLQENPALSSIYENPNVKPLVVSPDKVRERGLNPKNFYEYFAKNAGVRSSKFEWLLIQNPDILISEELGKEIVDVVTKTPEENELFFRMSNRIGTSVASAHSGAWINERCQNLIEPRNRDNHVLGAYGGDILLVTKRVFCEFGKGYDETNVGHKSNNLRQTGMDGEILLNMHINGARMKVLSSKYGHINHGHPAKRDGHILWDGYSNIEDWGSWL